MPVVDRKGSMRRPLHIRQSSPLDWAVVRDSLRRPLSDDVEMLDFGTSSKAEGVTKCISIGQLEKRASTDFRKALWLAALSQSVAQSVNHVLTILEMGTCLGAGAVSLVLGAGGRCRYVGLEGSPHLAAIARNRLCQVAPETAVDLRVGPFRDTLPSLLRSEPEFDLVFLDGHHEGRVLLEQWACLHPHLRPGAWVMVDDIRWSKDMHAAWNVLASQPDVEAVDLFRMGALRNSIPDHSMSGVPRRVPFPLFA